MFCTAFVVQWDLKCSFLYRCVNLQTVLLHSNKIAKIDEASFYNVVKLSTLRLDYNDIKKIENLKGNRALTMLDLSNNAISNIEVWCTWWIDAAAHSLLHRDLIHLTNLKIST